MFRNVVSEFCTLVSVSIQLATAAQSHDHPPHPHGPQQLTGENVASSASIVPFESLAYNLPPSLMLANSDLPHTAGVGTFHVVVPLNTMLCGIYITKYIKFLVNLLYLLRLNLSV